MQQLCVEERKILEGRYIEGYRFIVRDSYDTLCLYTNRPKKGNRMWKNMGYGQYGYINNDDFFEFIKWEDDEPYEIEKLLDIKDDSI